ncbi:hypothetical protein ACFYOD_32675 [Streptomyces sp. NPDC006703]|uniref:hypothetical protein n=1 Tax=Streptomyces sp. NPDC006703 TaxID=3364759 RepID=UPI003697C868
MLHLWLHLEGLGPVLFHTPRTGLSLKIDQPHEPYSMEQHGHVTVTEDSPVIPVARFVGQTIRSVREIWYRDNRIGFAAGLTLRFPSGSIRLLALGDDLILACDQHLGPVEANLHEDVTVSRVA